MIPAKRSWSIVRELALKSRVPRLMLLYSYYVDHGEEAPNQETVRRETGLNNEHAASLRKAMEEIGLISVSKGPRGRLVVKALNPSTHTNIPSSVLLITNHYKGYVEEEETESGIGMALEEVESDEDWKRARVILLKYFKEYQINPRAMLPTKKKKRNYWNKLQAVLMDEDLDFDAYCQWYRINKYPRVKFNWGMFLYDGVIAEFKDDDEADNYLEVSSNIENDEAYRQLAEEEGKNLAVEIRKRRERETT